MTTTNTWGVTAAGVGCGVSVGTVLADGTGDGVGLARAYGVDRGAPLPPQAVATVTNIAQAANVASVRPVWIAMLTTPR